MVSEEFVAGVGALPGPALGVGAFLEGIGDQLESIRSALNEELTNALPPKATSEPWVELTQFYRPDGTYNSGAENRMVMFLANIQHQTPISEGQYTADPPPHIDLFVMFAANFANYSEGLDVMSRTINFFRQNPTSYGASLPIEVVNMDMADLSALIGIAGITYLPMALYKLRMPLPSIAGIATAIPAFIGYTEKAEVGGHGLTNKPQPITSMAEFEQFFGARDRQPLILTEETWKPTTHGAAAKEWVEYTIAPSGDNPHYVLHQSIELFYDNGGGQCWVVSVGSYDQNKINAADLITGLSAIKLQVGPTMLVVPDAVSLPPTADAVPWVSSSFRKVARAMLEQAASLKDRVALLDVYGSQFVVPAAVDVVDHKTQVALSDLIAQFREDVALDAKAALSYGIACFPFLETSLLSAADFTYEDIEPAATLVTALRSEAKNLYSGDYRTEVEDKIDEISTTPRGTEAAKILGNTLESMVPLLVDIERQAAAERNLLPSTGAIAGLLAMSDASSGVWNAPADSGLTAVLGPTFDLNDEQQAVLNAPIEGAVINALRPFADKGTVVWGTFTLDGRDIAVRRTLIYLEESIKSGLDGFVFDANTAETWATVTAMISNFLNGVWNQGGLTGDHAEAYEVQCGLGSTMTPTDLLDGYMKVQVTVNMIRPDEFVVLRFTLKM